MIHIIAVLSLLGLGQSLPNPGHKLNLLSQADSATVQDPVHTTHFTQYTILEVTEETEEEVTAYW